LKIRKEETKGDKIARRQVARVMDYKRTFNSEQGKRVLYDLFSAHYMLGSSFSKDPHEIAFREGQRQVLLRILTILKTNPEEMERLIKESHDHVTASD
jgi:hypothetical protein